MLIDRASALPRLPSGGNRRRLDEKWLAVLEREGISAFIAESNAETPSELHRGIAEFNAGAFWECHETLEDVWRASPYPLRFFYHAIIKVAVGFHHMGRHNRHGARVKLADGVRLLRLFQPDFMGVETGRLLTDAQRWLRRVEGEGRVDWLALDALPRPEVLLISVPAPGSE